MTHLERLRISGLLVPELLLLALPELLRLLLAASVKFLLELALLGCFLRLEGVYVCHLDEHRYVRQAGRQAGRKEGHTPEAIKTAPYLLPSTKKKRSTARSRHSNSRAYLKVGHVQLKKAVEHPRQQRRAERPRLQPRHVGRRSPRFAGRAGRFSNSLRRKRSREQGTPPRALGKSLSARAWAHGGREVKGGGKVLEQRRIETRNGLIRDKHFFRGSGECGVQRAATFSGTKLLGVSVERFFAVVFVLPIHRKNKNKNTKNTKGHVNRASPRPRLKPPLCSRTGGTEGGARTDARGLGSSKQIAQ